MKKIAIVAVVVAVSTLGHAQYVFHAWGNAYCASGVQGQVASCSGNDPTSPPTGDVGEVLVFLGCATPPNPQYCSPSGGGEDTFAQLDFNDGNGVMFASGHLSTFGAPYKDSAGDAINGTNILADIENLAFVATPQPPATQPLIISFDRLAAELSSRSITAPTKSAEAAVDPTGTRIEGFRIGGTKIEVELDLEVFTYLDTLAAISSAYQNNPAFRQIALQRWGWTTPPPNTGVTNIPLVKNLNCGSNPVGFTCTPPNQITVPGVGTLTLATYSIWSSHRGLTMVSLLPDPNSQFMKSVAAAGDTLQIASVSIDGEVQVLKNNLPAKPAPKKK